MQIRTDDDILSKYGSPSRPISPTFLPAPLKTTISTGSEPRELDDQATGSQLEREPHLQQPHQQAQSSTLAPPFPPELIDHVVDHLHDDKESLIQCSRTSRAFSHATSYHMFRTVRVPSVRRCVEFQDLIRSSLHPISSISTSPHPSQPSSASSTTSISTPPVSCVTHHQTTQAHPNSNHTNGDSNLGHAHASAGDIPAAGWDISKFVRRIEFYRLDPQFPIEVYVSEAVKLVRMLPRIREVVFGWWMRTNELKTIGQAFADTSAGHQDHPSSQPLSPAPTNTLSETRTEQTCIRDPLKLHLEFVNFDSVGTFLDLLESFGGRLRELSLASITFGRNERGDVKGRCLPGLESVCLGYDAVVQPKEIGQDGPTMAAMNTNMLFGISTFGLCEVLENIAPNVNELQLFNDDTAEVCMGLSPEIWMLRLPRFRRLKSVTVCVPGSHWTDLIYEIAAWLARDEKLGGEIADPACQGGRASALNGTPSPPSPSSATRADWPANWKKLGIRFAYPVRKGDVDWGKLASAVLGEDFEGLDGDGDCTGFGNYGEGGNDDRETSTRINHIENRGADGCSRLPTAGSFWVEVLDGSAGLGEVRGELGRLDTLGLLQVSCR